jgi:hypothetical protein
MPENIVDKVMEEWVYSGRLQGMSPAQIEEAIHHPTLSSLALPPQQGLEPLTIEEVVVEDKDWDRPPITISPGRKRRGKREFLDPKILFGPGNPFEKAKILGVSHMTVRRAIKELTKENK